MIRICARHMTHVVFVSQLCHSALFPRKGSSLMREHIQVITPKFKALTSQRRFVDQHELDLIC